MAGRGGPPLSRRTRRALGVRIGVLAHSPARLPTSTSRCFATRARFAAHRDPATAVRRPRRVPGDRLPARGSANSAGDRRASRSPGDPRVASAESASPCGDLQLAPAAPIRRPGRAIVAACLGEIASGADRRRCAYGTRAPTPRSRPTRWRATCSRSFSSGRRQAHGTNVELEIVRGVARRRSVAGRGSRSRVAPSRYGRRGDRRVDPSDGVGDRWRCAAVTFADVEPTAEACQLDRISSARASSRVRARAASAHDARMTSGLGVRVALRRRRSTRRAIARSTIGARHARARASSRTVSELWQASSTASTEIVWCTPSRASVSARPPVGARTASQALVPEGSRGKPRNAAAPVVIGSASASHEHCADPERHSGRSMKVFQLTCFVRDALDRCQTPWSPCGSSPAPIAATGSRRRRAATRGRPRTACARPRST